MPTLLFAIALSRARAPVMRTWSPLRTLKTVSLHTQNVKRVTAPVTKNTRSQYNINPIMSATSRLYLTSAKPEPSIRQASRKTSTSEAETCCRQTTGRTLKTSINDSRTRKDQPLHSLAFIIVSRLSESRVVVIWFKRTWELLFLFLICIVPLVCFTRLEESCSFG